MADKSASSKTTKPSGNTAPDAGSSSKPPVAPPRVIGNLATQGEGSKGGGMKLKFTPNMPTKKTGSSIEAPVKVPVVPKASTEPSRGRGRGRGRGRDGGGRGAAPEMVPAGPFAMGPLAAGMTGVSRPSAFRGIRAQVPSTSSGGGIKLEQGITSLPRNRDHLAADDEHEEYSEEESGLAIVDMEDVKLLDTMAPDALKKEKPKEKRKVKVKSEPVDGDVEILAATETSEAKAVNTSQALDLSESEEEIELEDLRQHFVVNEEDLSMQSGQLYFFQFPETFPTFVTPQRTEVEAEAPKPDSPGKKVSFAEDVKAAPSEAESEKPQNQGLIGQLEIHRSGAVRMKLANGNSFDVFAATQPSFLQQAVVVDNEERKMSVLGAISRRFVVTPDLDALLSQTVEDSPPLGEKMDVD